MAHSNKRPRTYKQYLKCEENELPRTTGIYRTSAKEASLAACASKSRGSIEISEISNEDNELDGWEFHYRDSAGSPVPLQAENNNLPIGEFAQHEENDQMDMDLNEGYYMQNQQENNQREENVEDTPFDAACFDSNAPVYEGSSLSRGQLLAMLMALALRHGFSGIALKDLLELLNVLSPGCVPRTKWFLDKTFFNLSEKAEIHFYCPECFTYLGQTPPNTCELCDIDLDEKQLLLSSTYFLIMPLALQLKNLMQQPSVRALLRSHFRDDNEICDINTGHLYREQGQFINCQDNITISFNCDGSPVFKSSRYSIWPILCTINELPVPQRRQHVILHTLWFGPKKPHMDTYFTPFVSELQTLHQEGFTWQDNDGSEHTTKVHALLSVCDAVARAMAQDFKQFNGAFGCGFCYSEGIVVEKGNGHARVYPMNEAAPPRRTIGGTVELIEMVAEQNDGQAIRGVKGASRLLLLPGFDIIRGFVPDYMHSVCLGVVRQFCNLWFDPKYADANFHLQHRHLEVIDSFLSNVHPPNEVRRTPRALSDRTYWKASEWRAFLLLYSPVILKQVLPRNYYNHWLLLASALHTLLSAKASAREINCAELCLVKFVTLARNLYGIEHCSYNCHLLTHQVQSVRDSGLLWANSAFVFEDTNGKLLDLFHGTQAVPHQIFKYFFARQKLARTGEILFQGAPAQASSLLHRLINTEPHINAASHVNRDVIVLGKPINRQLTANERVALENNNLEQYITHGQISVYERSVIENTIYTSHEYAEGHNRNNSVITTDHSYGVISSFVVVPSECDCATVCSCSELLIYFKKLTKLRNQQVVYNADVDFNVSNILVQVQQTNELSVCTYKHIKGKCLLLQQDGFCQVIKVPQFELD